MTASTIIPVSLRQQFSKSKLSIGLLLKLYIPNSSMSFMDKRILSMFNLLSLEVLLIELIKLAIFVYISFSGIQFLQLAIMMTATQQLFL